MRPLLHVAVLAGAVAVLAAGAALMTWLGGQGGRARGYVVVDLSQTRKALHHDVGIVTMAADARLLVLRARTDVYLSLRAEPGVLAVPLPSASVAWLGSCAPAADGS